MKVVLFFISMAWVSVAFANAKVVGNGGDVVVCKNKVIMLDLYEAETLRGYRLALGKSAETVDSKMDTAIKRIQRLDPQRASAMYYWATRFMKEAKFMRGIELRDVDDSNQDFLPEGCHLEQIAIQNTSVLPGDAGYIVDADLWDQLDNDNKAILILHEAIFKSCQRYSNWPSAIVRAFNSFGFTSYVDRKSLAEYYDMIFFVPIIHHSTVIAAQLANRLWIYQDANIALQLFVPPLKLDVERALVSFKRTCQDRNSGRAAMVTDLTEIQGAINQFHQYDILQHNRKIETPHMIWLDNGTSKPDLYRVSFDTFTKENFDPTVKAEVWCISSENPFSLN